MADVRALRETLARMHPDKAAMFRAQPDDFSKWSDAAKTQLANAAERRVNQGTFDSLIGPEGLAEARMTRDRQIALSRQMARALQAKQEIAEPTLSERWAEASPRLSSNVETRRLGAESLGLRISRALSEALNPPPGFEFNAPHRPEIRDPEAAIRLAAWDREQYPNPIRDLALERPFDPIDFKDQDQLPSDDDLIGVDEVGEELERWKNELPPSEPDEGLRAWGAPPTRGFSVRPKAAPPNNFATPATEPLDVDVTRDFVGEESPTFADRTTYGMPARASIYGPEFNAAFERSQMEKDRRGLLRPSTSYGPEVPLSHPELSTLSPEFDGTARRQRAMANLAGALSGAPSLADLGKDFSNTGDSVGVAGLPATRSVPSYDGEGLGLRADTTFADRTTYGMPAARPAPSISTIGPHQAALMGNPISGAPNTTSHGLMGLRGATYGDALGYGDGVMASVGSDDQSVGLFGAAGVDAPGLVSGPTDSAREAYAAARQANFAKAFGPIREATRIGSKSRLAKALAASPPNVEMATQRAVNYTNARNLKGKLVHSPIAQERVDDFLKAISDFGPTFEHLGRNPMSLGGGISGGSGADPLGNGGMGMGGPGGPGSGPMGRMGGQPSGPPGLGRAGPGMGAPAGNVGRSVNGGMRAATGAVSGPGIGPSAAGAAAHAADVARAERERAAASLNGGYAGMGFGGFGPGGMFGV